MRQFQLLHTSLIPMQRIYKAGEVESFLTGKTGIKSSLKLCFVLKKTLVISSEGVSFYDAWHLVDNLELEWG